MNFLTSATPVPSKPIPTGIRSKGCATTAVTIVVIKPTHEVTTEPKSVSKAAIVIESHHLPK